MVEGRVSERKVFGVDLDGAGGEAVRLAPAMPRAMLNLRGHAQDAGFASAVGNALGTALPEVANRWNGNARTAILWLGPDEWLIMAADRRPGDIESALRSSVGVDPSFSAVDVSHNYTGFELSGPASREVLAKGCPLDLHPRRFGPGHCAQTVLAKSRALLCATEHGIEIYVRNSFATYVASWLLDAMQEFSELRGFEA